MYSLILYGTRSMMEIQQFRILVNPFQNAAAAFSSTRASNFTVSYLVTSLSFTPKLAESISSKVSFEEKNNPDSVLNLFRSYGFTDSQISTIITSYPRLLVADVEKSLAPKLRFLQSRASDEFTEIVSAVPKILGKKEGKSSSRYYDFVKEIVQADKDGSKLLPYSSPQQLGKQENKLRNLTVLRGLGLPQHLLFRMLTWDFPPVCGKQKFQESLKKVLEMGFDPTTSKFVQALRIIHGLKNETLEERVCVYKSLGLSEGDIWAMFKRWPICLTLSETNIYQKFETLEKCGLLKDEVLSVVKLFPQCIGVSEQNILDSVDTFLGLGFSRDEIAMILKSFPSCFGLSGETVKKKTEFIVKQMNWPLKAVVSTPQVFNYSMEKRIVPRCNVIKALMYKGLLSRELPALSSVVKITDEMFLKRYVRKHDDKKLVAELMAIFTRKMGKTDKASQ